MTAARAERDDLARAGMLLSLGSLVTASQPTLSHLHRTVRRAGNYRECLAASISLARLAGRQMPAGARYILESVDATAAEHSFSDLPWDVAVDIELPLDEMDAMA